MKMPQAFSLEIVGYSDLEGSYFRDPAIVHQNSIEPRNTVTAGPAAAPAAAEAAPEDKKDEEESGMAGLGALFG